MAVKAHVTINIADAEQAIAEYLAARMPGVEVTGVTVMSWNTTVFEYSDMKMVEPPHVIRQDHKVFNE